MKTKKKRNPELHGEDKDWKRSGFAESPIFLRRWVVERKKNTLDPSIWVAGKTYKPVAAYSRTRRRGRSLKISIRDFHCNERRGSIAAHRQEAFNFMQIDDGHRWKRRADTSRGRCARARTACLLLKCLHRPFACRNAPDIADFSSTAAGNARPFAKIFCLRIPFFFFRRTISSL